jgi:hypothetical protein
MLRELGTVEFLEMFAVVLTPMASLFVVWLLSRRFRRIFLPGTQADVDAFLRQYDASLRPETSRASHSAAPLRSTHPYARRNWISWPRLVSLALLRHARLRPDR